MLLIEGPYDCNVLLLQSAALGYCIACIKNMRPDKDSQRWRLAAPDQDARVWASNSSTDNQA
jgi:hypothetical protein